MDLYWKLIRLLHRPFQKHGSDDPYHHRFPEFQTLVRQRPNPELLEIGSRNVSSEPRSFLWPDASRYVGLDIHPGEGVDIVGDAHRLSEYFEAGSFDGILSFSVFEHLAFPWKVVIEMNKVLRLGGYVFIMTHPAWPEHEAPWDFWRFPRAGLTALFQKPMGFEMVTVTEGIPCKLYPLVDDRPPNELYRYIVNVGVSMIAKKIGDYDHERIKWDVSLEDVVDSQYPSAPLNQRPQQPTGDNP